MATPESKFDLDRHRRRLSGTDVSLRTNGALMIDLFNYLKYDAWIVGNHEFDWGVEPS